VAAVVPVYRDNRQRPLFDWSVEGGNPSCYGSGSDEYGRFDVAYSDALHQWLNAGPTFLLSVSKLNNRQRYCNFVPERNHSAGRDAAHLLQLSGPLTLTQVQASQTRYRPCHSLEGWSLPAVRAVASSSQPPPSRYKLPCPDGEQALPPVRPPRIL